MIGYYKDEKETRMFIEDYVLSESCNYIFKTKGIYYTEIPPSKPYKIRRNLDKSITYIPHNLLIGPIHESLITKYKI